MTNATSVEIFFKLFLSKALLFRAVLNQTIDCYLTASSQKLKLLNSLSLEGLNPRLEFQGLV